MMKNKITLSEKTSHLFILAAAVLWGFIGLSVRKLSAMGLTTAELTLVRSAAVFVTALILILLTDSKQLFIRARDIPLFLGSGIMSIVFFNICYFITQQTLTLSLACILLYTAPFFVLIMSSVFFGERITTRKLIALLCAFLGCVFSSGFISDITGGGGFSVKGLMFGLGSGFGYALYSIFGRAAVKRYGSLTYMLYTFFVAALALLPFVNVRNIAVCAASCGAVQLILFSLLFTMLPYLLYTKGLEKTEAGKASITAFAEPLTAAVVGAAFFSEKPTGWLIIGTVLIFTAVALLSKTDNDAQISN